VRKHQEVRPSHYPPFRDLFTRLLCLLSSLLDTPPHAVGQQGCICGLQTRSYGSGDGRLSPMPATGDPALSFPPMSEQLNELAVERSGPGIAVRTALYWHRPGFVHRRR
jgi:hypothetical protein